MVARFRFGGSGLTVLFVSATVTAVPRQFYPHAVHFDHDGELDGLGLAGVVRHRRSLAPLALQIKRRLGGYGEVT
jgi:hypothetical protein